jgi:hypothetical protein
MWFRDFLWGYEPDLSLSRSTPYIKSNLYYCTTGLSPVLLAEYSRVPGHLLWCLAASLAEEFENSDIQQLRLRPLAEEYAWKEYRDDCDKIILETTEVIVACFSTFYTMNDSTWRFGSLRLRFNRCMMMMASKV